MFEKQLKDTLSKIFRLDKVTFDAPSKEAREQGVLFIDVVKTNITAKKGIAKGMVSGVLSVFAPADKITFGYFNKAIELADASDKVDIYFHAIDQSGEYFVNLVERRCAFVYSFRKQYDPETGETTAVLFDPTLEELEAKYDEELAEQA